MRTEMNRLSDDAQVWIFGAASPLSPEQGATLLAEVNQFLESWAAHGSPVTAAAELRENRFLVVAATCDHPSGCSIDRFFQQIRALEQHLGASLMDSGLVFIRDRETGQPLSMTRGELKAMGARGEVLADTLVFDNAVTTLREVRHGGWEKPAAKSWHGAVAGVH